MDCNDKTIFNTILSQNDLKMDKNYNIKYKFTYKNDFTHAIIMNKANPVLNIPKENVIGLAQEPINLLNLNTKYIEYCKKNMKKYFIGNINWNNINLKNPFVEKNSYILPGIKIENIPQNYPDKNKIMNYVYSCKKDPSPPSSKDSGATCRHVHHELL